MTDDTKQDTIRSRAVAAAQNIGEGDTAAALVVAQADGTMRVTPFATDPAGAIQLLALGASMIAGKLQVKPVRAAPVTEDEALPVS